LADDLTHFDKTGRPRMVDVSAKADTERAGPLRVAAYVFLQKPMTLCERTG